MFHVEYDHRANCLTIRVEGFWQPEDVAPLAREVNAKGREAKAVRGDFNVIVESLQFPVQANDVADLLTGIMRGGMTLTTGRAAVGVGPPLNKLQADRTLVNPRLRVFVTLEEARGGWGDDA